MLLLFVGRSAAELSPAPSGLLHLRETGRGQDGSGEGADHGSHRLPLRLRVFPVRLSVPSELPRHPSARCTTSRATRASGAHRRGTRGAERPIANWRSSQSDTRCVTSSGIRLKDFRSSSRYLIGRFSRLVQLFSQSILFQYFWPVSV